MLTKTLPNLGDMLYRRMVVSLTCISAWMVVSGHFEPSPWPWPVPLGAAVLLGLLLSFPRLLRGYRSRDRLGVYIVVVMFLAATPPAYAWMSLLQTRIR